MKSEVLMKKVFKSLGMAVLFFLLFFGMQFIVSIVFCVVAVASFLSQNAGSLDMPALIEKITESVMNDATLIATISNILTVLILFLIFMGQKKKFTLEADIRKLKVKALVLPLLLGITLYAAVSMILGMLPIPQTLLDQYSDASGYLFNGSIWITILAVAIVAPITEEIVFRGFILSRLRRSMPPVVAAIISSVIFGAAHGNWVWMAYAFVLGMILCYVAIKYRSIVASMALHIAFNLLGVIASNFENLEAPNFVGLALLVFGLVGSVIIMVVINKNTAIREMIEAPAIPVESGKEPPNIAADSEEPITK